MVPLLTFVESIISQFESTCEECMSVNVVFIGVIEIIHGLVNTKKIVLSRSRVHHETLLVLAHLRPRGKHLKAAPLLHSEYPLDDVPKRSVSQIEQFLAILRVII